MCGINWHKSGKIKGRMKNGEQVPACPFATEILPAPRRLEMARSLEPSHQHKGRGYPADQVNPAQSRESEVGRERVMKSVMGQGEGSCRARLSRSGAGRCGISSSGMHHILVPFAGLIHQHGSTWT